MVSCGEAKRNKWDDLSWHFFIKNKNLLLFFHLPRFGVDFKANPCVFNVPAVSFTSDRAALKQLFSFYVGMSVAPVNKSISKCFSQNGSGEDPCVCFFRCVTLKGSTSRSEFTVRFLTLWHASTRPPTSSIIPLCLTVTSPTSSQRHMEVNMQNIPPNHHPSNIFVDMIWLFCVFVLSNRINVVPGWKETL